MHLLRFLLFSLSITVANPLLAASISLDSLKTYKENDNYFVDAEFELDFSEKILEALKHGIPVQINTDLEIQMIRDWLPDKTIKTVNFAYQLLHQPLTEDYLTINLKTGLRHSYDSLFAALTKVGHLSDINLINSQTLAKNKIYKGRIRMYLNLDSLPSPMRPQVYFSSDWKLSSDWHEWKLTE